MSEKKLNNTSDNNLIEDLNSRMEKIWNNDFSIIISSNYSKIGIKNLNLKDNNNYISNQHNINNNEEEEEDED
ncbi:hypothetical protein U3516DRAFT_771497 [Neocallimastix sp. 'constans']